MNATATAIWHDVECGGYDADLPLWEELAERRGGTVLELGCGTGRVALHLAQRGHRVIGLDRDPVLIASLAQRASDSLHSGVGQRSGAPAGLVEPLVGDAREFELDEPVALALAPMQFLQLLPTRTDRVACLRHIAVALEVGGLLGVAIVERVPESAGALPPLPDMREVDGWVYSSFPVATDLASGRIILRRRRRAVSPEGDLREEDDEVQLWVLTAERLEDEAEEAGLLPVDRRHIPETEAHVGSTVVLLERTR